MKVWLAVIATLFASGALSQEVRPPSGPLVPRPDTLRPGITMVPGITIVIPSSTCRNPDKDGDGVKDTACGGSDCDDNNNRRFPGNHEICDAAGLDEDCDDTTFGTRDADGDGFVDARCRNTQHNGRIVTGADCDDSRRTTHPNAPEVCDAIDNNCDGAVDDYAMVRLFVDGDRDGYGDARQPLMACAGSAGASTLNNDCDDKNVAVRPGSVRCGGQNPSALEICGSDGTWFGAGTCPGGTRCETAVSGVVLCVVTP